MNNKNDNELSYVENITIILITKEIVSNNKSIELSNQSKRSEQKNFVIKKLDGKIYIRFHVNFVDDNLIIEKGIKLQKEIIDEIKWMINLDVDEVNIYIDKLIYSRGEH